MENKRNKLQSLQYSIIGVILVVTAGTNIENFPVVGYFTLFLGILVLFHFMYHVANKTTNRNIAIIGHLIEGIALLCSAYIMYKIGKTYLPYVFLLSSIGFFAAAVVKFVKVGTPEILKFSKSKKDLD